MSFMDKENFIIKAFLQGINGDDGAVLGKWCYSKDLFLRACILSGSGSLTSK